jgi:hypothetical protein
MTTADVLHQAQAAGVELSPSPTGNIHWRSPNPLPDDLRQALVVYKSELVELLRQREDEAFICRAIERNLGLPVNSLTLWEPIRRQE